MSSPTPLSALAADDLLLERLGSRADAGGEPVAVLLSAFARHADTPLAGPARRGGRGRRRFVTVLTAITVVASGASVAAAVTLPHRTSGDRAHHGLSTRAAFDGPTGATRATDSTGATGPTGAEGLVALAPAAGVVTNVVSGPAPRPTDLPAPAPSTPAPAKATPAPSTSVPPEPREQASSRPARAMPKQPPAVARAKPVQATPVHVEPATLTRAEVNRAEATQVQTKPVTMERAEAKPAKAKRDQVKMERAEAKPVKAKRDQVKGGEQEPTGDPATAPTARSAGSAGATRTAPVGVPPRR